MVQSSAPAKPSPIGVNDVAEIIGTAAEQLFDLATHFESISREPESHALSRVALQLMSQALFFRSRRKLGSTKNFDVVVMSLRSAGTIDGDTYQDLTRVLAGENLKGKSMRRMIDTLRQSQRREVTQ